MRRLGWIPFLLFIHCSSATVTKKPGPTTGPEEPSPVDAADDEVDAAPVSTLDAGTLAPDLAPATCDPPDVLIVLDRTVSMRRTPSGGLPSNTVGGRAQSKWGLAVNAVHQLTAAPTDGTVRFGLELFPKNPGGGQCKTLPQILSGISPTNSYCQSGEVLTPPELSIGSTIDTELTQDNTPLCASTPIGAALDSAANQLMATSAAGHTQFIVLVSDGRENCGTGPVNAIAQAAQDGVLTHVIGFGADLDAVNVQLLNAMACAGQTAKDFATSCVMSGTTYVPVQPNSTVPLYYDARDGTALQTQLNTVTGQLCCGCSIT